MAGQGLKVEAKQGMRLTVEIGSPLFIQFEGREERLKSVFVGMEPDAFLILRTPASPEIDGLLKEGNSLVVRYICLGNAFGFRSKILNCFHDPFRVMFLSYPDSVEALNLRMSQRVACNIPATVSYGGRETRGLIVDLSSSGCRFSCRLSPSEAGVQMGDELELTFLLWGIEGEQHFSGTVRNLAQDKEGLSIGIQFTRVDGGIAVRIDDYLRRVVEYHRF